MIFFTFFASLIAATLAAMGVGGGGLLVIYLAVFLLVDQHKAQGINLMFFIVSSLSSLPIHLKNRKIHRQIVVIFWIFGAVGAVVGCKLSLLVNSETLRRCFGGLLVFAAITTLIKSLKEKKINTSQM